MIYKSAQDLELAKIEATLLKYFIKQIRENLIHIGEEQDKLIWMWNNKDGKFQKSWDMKQQSIQNDHKQTVGGGHKFVKFMLL